MPQDLEARLVAQRLVPAEEETGMVLDLGHLDDQELPSRASMSAGPEVRWSSMTW
jgi:hypothetical protein